MVLYVLEYNLENFDINNNNSNDNIVAIVVETFLGGSLVIALYNFHHC